MKRAGISLALVVMLLLGAAARFRPRQRKPGWRRRRKAFTGRFWQRKTAKHCKPIWTVFRTSAGWNCGQSSPQRCGRGWIPFCSR